MDLQIAILVIIVSFIIGILCGYFLIRIRKKKTYDGQLIIGEQDGRDQFRFIFSKDLEELQGQKELCLEIIKTQNSQAL